MGLLAVKAKNASRRARRPLEATGARGSATTKRNAAQSNKEAWRLEVASWPENLRDIWVERAAMIQHGDGQTREMAEWLAYLQAPAEYAAWQECFEHMKPRQGRQKL